MGPGIGARLSPTTASNKLLALAFIERYLTQFRGRSPSYGEIGGALGVGRETAKRIVRRLARDGSIVRVPGARRGIALPGQVEEAVALLIACRWTVDGDAHALVPPTKTTLTLVAELDHPPDDEFEGYGDGRIDGNDGDRRDRGSGGGQGDARDRDA